MNLREFIQYIPNVANIALSQCQSKSLILADTTQVMIGAIFLNQMTILKYKYMRLIFGFLFIWACRNDAPILNSDPDYYPATINEIIRREGYTVKSGHGDKYHKTVKTRLDALKLLQNRIDSIYNKVGNEAPILTRNQKLAVTSLVYNIGFAKLKKMRLWQSIKQGKTNFQDWIEICYFNNNGKKVKSANLRKSRQFEIELFNEK